MTKKATSLSAVQFTGDPRVQACLKTLDERFNTPGRPPLIVSDVLDDQGHQYVNLVQKGGGVLGIALVGYTYILEQMGIRFLRLAGTSAGAINTSMMTVIGNKQDPKSEQILDELCNLNFFNLVDGHPAARLVIRNFITNKDFGAKLKTWISVILLILVLLLVGDFIFLGLQHRVPWTETLTRTCFVLTGFYVLALGVAGAYISSLLKRLKNSGFGINPGDYFYDWIKSRLAKYGVHTVTDLNGKASAAIPGLNLRVPHEAGTQALKGDVTFIASELVTENKIQFPLMCPLFRKPADIDQLQPAGFIRASMSIPIFFESYFISDIPCDDEEIKAAWVKYCGDENPPETARFVDGGILSNFPINLFYNPDIRVPRLPTFGIDLDDSKPQNKERNPAAWSPPGYFGRMFNTIRFYYDKDFLLKNRLLEKGIGKVPLSEYNWLNFFLKDQQKIDMFAVGAQAATDFLMNFKWEDYKDDRTRLHEQLQH